MTRYTVGISAVLILAGCMEAEELKASPRGSISAGIAIGTLRYGLDGIRFEVMAADASCEGEAILSMIRSLEEEELPASFEETTGRFADALFVLPAGPYRVCATPIKDFAPSGVCRRADMLVNVLPGETTEVLLISECADEGTGGLDVVVALNGPPRITEILLDPSKFITVCESLAITVSAEDPDGDAIEYDFALITAPPGAGSLVADGNTARFSGAAGDYVVRVTATDERGQSTSLTFPIYVSDATCAVPEAVQALFAATCSPCHIAGASGGLGLGSAEASYAGLVEAGSSAAACATRTRVIPGDPDGSYLMAKLRGEPDLCGAPMPRGAPPLSAEQLAILEDWIVALPL